MAISFTWLGHSAFAFDIDGHAVVIDPFLTGNPLAAARHEDLSAEVILLSHAHADHLGDTVPLAKRTGARVVTTFEVGQYLFEQGVTDVHQGNPGGSVDLGFMTVKYTIAFHSSSFPDGRYGGVPVGFLMHTRDSNKRLYYANDTALFSDMQLIGQRAIDVAFLPIGDTFTMGIADSIQAIKWLRPRFVVPMHYNTFDVIAQPVHEWAQRVANETDAQPVVLDPGNTYLVQ
jgi:L-ascorbate metabolism protein UlaG (beta-lactamase superfamily)